MYLQVFMTLYPQVLTAVSVLTGAHGCLCTYRCSRLSVLTGAHGCLCTYRCSRLSLYLQVLTAVSVPTGAHGCLCTYGCSRLSLYLQVLTAVSVPTGAHGCLCTYRCSRRCWSWRTSVWFTPTWSRRTSCSSTRSASLSGSRSLTLGRRATCRRPSVRPTCSQDITGKQRDSSRWYTGEPLIVSFIYIYIYASWQTDICFVCMRLLANFSLVFVTCFVYYAVM